MIELHQMIKSELEEITQLLNEEKEAISLDRIIKRLKADLAQHALREEKDAIPLTENYLDAPNDHTKSKLTQMIEKLFTEHQLFDELIDQLETSLDEKSYSEKIAFKINQLKETMEKHDQLAKNLYKNVIIN